jgi:hypothetical protein
MHPARLVEYRGDDRRRPCKMRGVRAGSGRSGYFLTETLFMVRTNLPWFPGCPKGLVYRIVNLFTESSSMIELISIGESDAP